MAGECEDLTCVHCYGKLGEDRARMQELERQYLEGIKAGIELGYIFPALYNGNIEQLRADKASTMFSTGFVAQMQDKTIYVLINKEWFRA